jgi:hypothetical protein
MRSGGLGGEIIWSDTLEGGIRGWSLECIGSRFLFLLFSQVLNCEPLGDDVTFSFKQTAYYSSRYI